MVSILVLAALAATCLAAVPGVPEDLYGVGLREYLRQRHANHRALSYEEARLSMYTYIYSSDEEEVECIYTGLLLACPKDSTTPDCNNNLNCEHVVPQSRFGSAMPMKSDMHHIRPTFKSANSARGNYGFRAIPDEDVDKWYKNDVITRDRPEDPENWSQLDSGKSWEPRDAFKGQAARIAAYFFTMYPDFFYNMPEVIDADDMFDWHERFPVTEQQMDEHTRVVEIQGNMNPYVLWPELLERAYCDISAQGCSQYE